MEYTGENAVPKTVNMEAYKPTTLKIYSATLSDAQIKAVDSAKLAGFRNTEGGEKTAASSGASITKATGKAEGEYLTSAASVRDLFGKTFFIDSTGNVYINKLSDTTEYKGTYRLTGSAKCNKPIMVFSNYTGKPHTFNVETNGVKLTTAEGVSPFVTKGNGPTTINVIGSGTSEFEANGTGVFYAANNIKVTLNIIKTDAKAEVFMKNSATRLQAVSCVPYSGKVSSTTKTESGEFYTYSSGSITKKEDTIVLHNDFAYYKVVTCNRKAKGTSGDSNHNWWTSGAKTNVDKYTQWGCGDYGDLNGDVGKGWLALYTETNPEHDPIEAGTFVVKFNDEVPSGYDNAIHLFGSSAAVNLNSSRWDFNADTTYVYYKTDHIHTFTHGDVNNDGMIDIKDATEIQRYAAQFIELDSTALAAADVSGDGNVTIADATKIQRYIAKLINELVTVST